MAKLLEMGDPSELDILRQRVEELEEQVEKYKADARKAMEDSARTSHSLSFLRKQLEPLHRALRGVFGELDAAGIGVEETRTPGGPLQPQSPSAWQAWKNQLPPSCGKIIDALLVQPLTSTQLKSMCKVSYETVRQSLLILSRNSLIEKEGDLNRLKRL